MEIVIQFVFDQRKWILYEESWDEFLNMLDDSDYFPLWKKVEGKTYFFITPRADYEELL